MIFNDPGWTMTCAYIGQAVILWWTIRLMFGVIMWTLRDA